MPHYFKMLNKLVFFSFILVNIGSLAYGQTITYGGSGFIEAPANDGSVLGEITAELSGDTFAA
ncbi:MAG: hypothetical protein ACI9XU_001783, partial [Arenicella sp.]